MRCNYHYNGNYYKSSRATCSVFVHLERCCFFKHFPVSLKDSLQRHWDDTIIRSIWRLDLQNPAKLFTTMGDSGDLFRSYKRFVGYKMFRIKLRNNQIGCIKREKREKQWREGVKATCSVECDCWPNSFKRRRGCQRWLWLAMNIWKKSPRRPPENSSQNGNPKLPAKAINQDDHSRSSHPIPQKNSPKMIIWDNHWL